MSKNKPERSNIGDLLNQFAAQEEKFLEGEFLAPTISCGKVRVRIGGVVCQIAIAPREFRGWGVFRPVSFKEAKLVREASLLERRKYLDLFPAIALIVCHKQRNRWLGCSARKGDGRVHLDGLAPIQLAAEVQTFDGISVRYDGSLFWFDEVDTRQNMSSAVYLREELEKRTEPKLVAKKGLTAEQRAAYELCYWELMRPPVDPAMEREGEPLIVGQIDPVHARLRENLSHAGAELIDYLERVDGYRVRYSVQGQTYTSSVNKEDLTVQVAGICLSGEDEKFDLASLVGVLREGDDDFGIVRVGDDGFTEEQYWQAHPRRP